MRTKVEYKDGFLNKETKELKYKSIREIKMVQSVLERIFGIGYVLRCWLAYWHFLYLG